MGRYIDVKKAIERIENDCLEQVYYSKQDAIDCINCIPSADVVEVVRCGDCKHRFLNHKCLNQNSGYYERERNSNDFCSYGERIDEK